MRFIQLSDQHKINLEHVSEVQFTEWTNGESSTVVFSDGKTIELTFSETIALRKVWPLHQPRMGLAPWEMEREEKEGT